MGFSDSKGVYPKLSVGQAPSESAGAARGCRGGLIRVTGVAGCVAKPFVETETKYRPKPKTIKTTNTPTTQQHNK